MKNPCQIADTAYSVDVTAETTRENKVRCRQVAVPVILIMLWTWAGISPASNLFGGHGPAEIKVDIKPDDPENIIRSSAGRVITAAIFGSIDFDVLTINPRTIRLNGVDVMLVGKSDKSLCQYTDDINDDGYKDLVCEIRTTGFKVGEGEFTVILKAATYNGESLRGKDRIRIVGN